MHAFVRRLELEMFFDDRLATVLRQRASSDVGLRTQFRQLLDILGAVRPGESSARDPGLVAAAWLRMDALADQISASDRAKMIREPGWRFRNPELAAHLADFEPDVASAALGRAQLSSEDWSALIPRLPVRARGFMRLRRDLPVDVSILLERLGVHDRGLPTPQARSPESAAEHSPETAPVIVPQSIAPTPSPTPDLPTSPPFDPASEGRSEISALVERIAQFKRTRETSREAAQDGDSNEPRLPLGEEQSRAPRLIQAFGFAADAGGRIEWADGEAAAMVIGTRLIAQQQLGSNTGLGPLERAFARRQPIVAASTELDGASAIAGKWTLDAQPRFTDDGNFAGYFGRFRRPAGSGAAVPSAAARDADRIRQLLHELRTPVTAVQGYAEVIQQQLFGGAPHEYRALAAAIAGDAARILAGFEELDRLARLETGALEIDAGESDLTDLVHRTIRQLDHVLQPRMAGIALESGNGPYLAALDPDQAEALLWRLLATLGGGCSAGEMLEAGLSAQGGLIRLTCDLPAQLLGEDDIFTAEAKPIGTAINAGLFGAGFALRLARAEARAAGGGLTRDGETIVLTLPQVKKTLGETYTSGADGGEISGTI
ncbi:histidine kinase dimerization/phospho-acceptor domain-containing protein [Qipengyuania sp. ASV99]|uniref:histidine kinase dimerization/phospho-acceptor domain-containing protein n=1 Tax=Qipengyuania sp. ASV99 TaxID=3399681 RepID=UPI003A4C5837